MRSFSNIMPNFADKLHLLVDSIFSCQKPFQEEKKAFSLGGLTILKYLCT